MKFTYISAKAEEHAQQRKLEEAERVLEYRKGIRAMVARIIAEVLANHGIDKVKRLK